MQPSAEPPEEQPSVRDLERRLLAEQAARAQADRAVARLSVLLQVTERLAGAAEVSQIASSIVQIATRELDADSAAVCRLDAADGRFEVVAAAGMDEPTLAEYRHFPLDAPLPAGDAVRERRPVFLRSVEDRDARYPMLRGRPAPHPLYVVLPLLVEERGVGALAMGWAAGKDIGISDLPLLSAVAQQVAQAMERGRLFEAERTARTEAEIAAEQAREASDRVMLLAEVGTAMGATLDPDALLRRLVRSLLPAVADQASAYVRDGDGLRFVDVAHVRPDLQAVARGLAADTSVPTGRDDLLDVAVTGRSRLITDVDDVLLAGLAPDDERLARLRSLGMRSIAAVPLLAGSRPLGVLACAHSVSGRTHTEDDLELLEEVGRRAGVALDNARAHQALAEVARSLQRSLLPTELPAVPGVALAARYHPASDGEPGGDLYDAWPLQRGRGEPQYAVLVADVSGRGVPAAALTASVRHTARAVARDCAQPSEVLRRVSEALYSAEGGEAFCTAAYLVVTPAGPGRPVRVELALGGAPLPLLRRESGAVTAVGRPGAALGLFPRPELSDVSVDLMPGDVLVVHTDGYTDARATDAGFAEGLLERLLAASLAPDAQALARELEQATLDFQDDRPRDDLALVLLEAAPPGQR